MGHLKNNNKKNLIDLMLPLFYIFIILFFIVFFCFSNSKVDKSDNSVEQILLDYKNVVLKIGDKININATLIPDSISNNEIKWESSNNSVASVSSLGEVIAVGEGVATIKASVGSKNAIVEIRVTKDNVDVSSISLNKKNATLYKNESVQLTVNFEPSNTTNRKVTWKSSNVKVATVNSSGLVTAKGEGSATITATVSGKRATATIKVTGKNIKVSSIEFNSKSEYLTVGNKMKLQPVIKPSNATNKAVSWKSSNTKVATVSSSGEVVAKSVGTAIITATVDGKNADVTIKVIKKTIKVSSITLNKSSATLYTNASPRTVQLNATIKPSNATNKVITWKSSNVKVATVDSSGLVTATGVGSVTITASVGGKSTTANIKVLSKNIAVTGVTLSKENVSLKYGENIKLVASVKPNDATNKAVIWKSSNTGLVTVDSNGNVVAKSGKIGVATITATTVDGNFSQKVQVKVFPSGSHISFKGGSNYTKYKTNMLLQRTGAVMQSFAFAGDSVYITQQQAGVGAYYSKIKLDSVTNSTGSGQKFTKNVAIIKDTGHAGNIDIEVAKDGNYLWTGCSVDGASTSYHCRIPLSSIQFGNKVVQEQNYDIKVAGGTLISVDESNRTFVVLTGSRRYHKYAVYNLDDYIAAARKGTKPTVISSFTIDRKNTKYHRQGFSVYGNYIYDYEGNYTNEKDSNGNPVPYDIFLSVYTLDGKEVVGRTKINYPDSDYYWEPEGIQIHNNKIYIGIGRIEKKKNPKKTANIYVLK